MSRATVNGGPRRSPPALIVITDVTVAPEAVIEARVEHLLAHARPATVMVQLRDKELDARRRLTLGRRLRGSCLVHGQWFVVNDRVDIATLLDADGIHLGEGAVSTADARALVGPEAWISRACHDPGRAAELDADAVLLSPCLAARKGRPALELEGIAGARGAIVAKEPGGSPLLYALGGIDSSNVAGCMESGANGVAAIGAVLDGRDPLPLLGALGILR